MGMDVVSVGRSSSQNGEEKSVPADMPILVGSVILNEDILTGESTPQWKISIAGRGMEEKLSAKQDKSHVLFGGTKILQHTPDKVNEARSMDRDIVESGLIFAGFVHLEEETKLLLLKE
ncbi:hypothetical protein VNO80_01880 [Phaseolus coccineus]|uniref:P-type ATPase A domain-containing protein n=1 Tax=Phaseolus coccineus TaxID=3886 RepID=A0AAN9RTQ4_PHACN